MRTSLLPWAVMACALQLAPAWGDERLPPPGLETRLHAIVASGLAPGATAIVFDDGELSYQVQAGDIETDAPMPVASASKWVAAALIMTLVDEGRLVLDHPIGLRLITANTEAGAITLRQLLSFTSGQGSLLSHVDLSQPANMTLAGSAQDILSRPLDSPAGQVFEYGSGALQVAGALAEQVTGQSWQDLFEERLAGPLGMTNSYWSHPSHHYGDGIASNPNLQAGLIASIQDYGRFLSMLANGGTFEGQRILSAEAIETMETLQTSETHLGFVPPGMGTAVAGYALGNWCERADATGRCWRVSSPGATGFWPWIDRNSGLHGVLVARARFSHVVAPLAEAREIVLSQAR